MPISPWRVGQLSPTWKITMLRDFSDANAVMDLTGMQTSQLSLVIYATQSTSASQSVQKVQIGTGAGSFAITQVSPGVVTYALAVADVPTVPGQYYVRVGVDFGGTEPDYCDYIPWLIES